MLQPLYPDAVRLARAMAGSAEDIENEIRTKLSAAGQDGGYIYHSDHSVPNDVSLSNYQFALGLVRKYGRFD